MRSKRKRTHARRDSQSTPAPWQEFIEIAPEL